MNEEIKEILYQHIKLLAEHSETCIEASDIESITDSMVSIIDCLKRNYDV